jgi:uncharacterized protein YoxC
VSIAWLRDLVLIIFGLGATATLIFLVVLIYRVYRRLSPVLDSLRNTARTMENLTSTVEEEIAGPLAKAVAFVQGIRQAIGLVRQFTKRREEE